jgi:predicted nucleic acid-binding protein
MRSIAIVDAGPLVATADAKDPNHAHCLQVLQRPDLDLVIPALVIAEVSHLMAGRLSVAAEVAFLRGLGTFSVEPPTIDEWPAVADLVERYGDFPLGTTDAATVVLADRLGTDLIVTLDRRHFAAVQSPAGRHFRLLPDVTSVHEEPAPYVTTPT